MRHLTAPPLMTTILNLSPESEYEGVAFGQITRLRYGEQVWDTLDTSKLAVPAMVGHTCAVDLIGFLGLVRENTERAMIVRSVEYGAVLFSGRIVDVFSAINELMQPRSTEYEILLEFGRDAVMRFEAIYWGSPIDKHEVRPEELQIGNFISICPARIDLQAIRITG